MQWELLLQWRRKWEPLGDGMRVGVSHNSQTGASLTGGYDLSVGGSPSLGLNFSLGQNGLTTSANIGGVSLGSNGPNGFQMSNPDWMGENISQAQANVQAEMDERAKAKEKEFLKDKLGMTPEQIANLTDEQRASILKELGKEMEGNIADGTSRENVVSQFFGGIADGFRNIVNFYNGSAVSNHLFEVDANGNLHPRTCFVAGTKVHTKDGLKSIEDVQIGDVVLSWNEKTGEREYKEVTNLWVRETNLLYEVKLPGQEPIVTTWNHPFWSVTQSGWIAAKDLKEGEILSLEDGSKTSIESITHYETEETTVYNFEVEGNHTYYVSEAGVLVHNENTSYDAPWKTIENNPEQLDKSRRERHDFLVEYPLLDSFLTKLPIIGPMLEYDHAVTYAERGQMDEALLSAINAGLGAIPGQNIFIKGGKAVIRQANSPTNKKQRQGSPLQEWQKAKTKSINRDLNQGRIDEKTADRLQKEVNQEYWMRTTQQGGNYSDKTFEKKIREMNLKKEQKGK